MVLLRSSLCTAGNRKGRDIVRAALREASAAGLNVLRTFAHTTDDNFPFQVRAVTVNKSMQVAVSSTMRNTV